jgi:hypothetical protein
VVHVPGQAVDHDKNGRVPRPFIGVVYLVAFDRQRLADFRHGALGTHRNE